MIKIVSDLRQFGGFLPVPPVSSTNKADCHDNLTINMKTRFKFRLYDDLNNLRVIIHCEFVSTKNSLDD